MSHHDEYRQWPFLTQEEFELACAFFDQKYVRARLGPTRKLFKVRSRRNLANGSSYIEILRLLQPPEDENDLSLAFSQLSGDEMKLEQHIEMDEDADQEALQPNQTKSVDIPPGYSFYSHQPYVTYEIHLHPTYRVPTLWFTLHDLPMGESAFDLDAVYRYLVPNEYKSTLRSTGVTGGLSAAPHPITDVPAFFIHPCHTKESMESFDCPMTEYLMLWVGLVGGCVGLWVPHEMAQQNLQSKKRN